MMNSVSTSGLDWFRSAKFGLFIHWGLYSVPAGEWRGKKVSSIGEYLMHAEYIPISEYETIAAQFDPAGFNAREWVGRAEEAGMRYLVFTAKHHDGFAMYRSKVDRFNVVEATRSGGMWSPSWPKPAGKARSSWGFIIRIAWTGTNRMAATCRAI